MTKYEFLYRLQQGLAPMSPTERMERCAFYEELINDMTEDGYTEEEAAERLGDPSALAESILREEPEAPRNGGARRGWSGRWLDMVSELVQTGLGSIHLSSDRQEPFSQTVDPLGIVSLDVRWTSGEVDVAAEDREDILLTEHRSPEAPPLAVRAEDGVLRVAFTQPGRVCREQKQLTVRLPRPLADLLDVCSVSTASAEVELRELRAEKLGVHTQSGDVALHAVRALGADIVTVSGDAELELEAERWSVHTTSGDVTARGNAPEGADFQSISGDMDLGLDAGLLALRTVSGDFTVRGEAERVQVSVVSGSGDLAFDRCPAELGGNAVSGDLEFRLPAGSRFRTDMDTKSGDLICSGPGIDCGDGPLFRFKTISGDVTIQA